MLWDQQIRFKSLYFALIHLKVQHGLTCWGNFLNYGTSNNGRNANYIKSLYCMRTILKKQLFPLFVYKFFLSNTFLNLNPYDCSMYEKWKFRWPSGWGDELWILGGSSVRDLWTALIILWYVCLILFNFLIGSSHWSWSHVALPHKLHNWVYDFHTNLKDCTWEGNGTKSQNWKFSGEPFKLFFAT